MIGSGTDRPQGWSVPMRAALAEAHAFGFLGPGPIEAHLDHASAFARVIASACEGVAPARVADLGSGGGVPAFVLMELWPQTSFVLVESNQRRAAFLVGAIAELRGMPGSDSSDTALGLVDVQCIRAEEFGRLSWRATFDVVTARSFGPPAVTAECAAPLLVDGGRLVVSEPPASDGSRWSSEGLAQLGMDGGRVVVDTFSFFVADQVRRCPEEYPRRVGVPGRRRLF